MRLILVNTAYTGPCSDDPDEVVGPAETLRHQLPCGEAGTTCEADEYCAFPEGTCPDNNWNSGECIPLPENCDDDRPVCGCNGRTYENACSAAIAGINLAQDGPCPIIEAPVRDHEELLQPLPTP